MPSWSSDLEQSEQSPAWYAALSRRIEANPDGLKPIRLVMLSTWTTTLLRPALVVEGARRGLHLDLHCGEYGQLEQEILREEWRGGGQQTEVLVVAARPEDLSVDRAVRFHREGGAAAFDDVADDLLGRIEATVRLFRERSSGPVLVADFSPAWPPPLGVFEANDSSSLSFRIQELNRDLARRVGAWPGAHVWGYSALVAERGRRDWTDARLWSLTRTPVAASHHPALAASLARAIRGVLAPPAKCLVLDLDNTLWGGAVGDLGTRGIELGDDHPGRAFKEFQRVALALRDRGILLAIASKNDRDVVEAVLGDHPEMLVTMDDFAATRINWQPKSTNLRSIAEELNIGLDALVLFDDNPVERAEVRIGAPDVQVIDVPTDPVLYPRALADFEGFDTPSITDEDRGRAASYEAQVRRRESEERAGSLDEFLTSLEMKASIGRLDQSTVWRIAQLVGKTNQFNLTTRRQGQPELEEMAGSDLGVHWLRLSDRYGDLGLICVAVLRGEGPDAVVHNLVLSCRVANRGVEQTMLSHLSAVARDAGYEALVGEYIPSARNHVVEDLYPRLGFEPLEPDGEVARFRRSLDQILPIPEFIDVRIE